MGKGTFCIILQIDFLMYTVNQNWRSWTLSSKSWFHSFLTHIVVGHEISFIFSCRRSFLFVTWQIAIWFSERHFYVVLICIWSHNYILNLLNNLFQVIQDPPTISQASILDIPYFTILWNPFIYVRNKFWKLNLFQMNSWN